MIILFQFVIHLNEISLEISFIFFRTVCFFKWKLESVNVVCSIHGACITIYQFLFFSWWTDVKLWNFCILVTSSILFVNWICGMTPMFCVFHWFSTCGYFCKIHHWLLLKFLCKACWNSVLFWHTHKDYRMSWKYSVVELWNIQLCREILLLFYSVQAMEPSKSYLLCFRLHESLIHMLSRHEVLSSCGHEVMLVD